MNKSGRLSFFIVFCTMFAGTYIKAQTSSAGVNDVQAISIAFDAALTTPYLNPPQVSGVINDPTDPAQNNGIVIDLQSGGAPILAANYTLTATSSKTSVVPVANILITPSDGYATIKIIPTGVGYSNIALKLTSAGSNKSITINYAASAASSTPNTTFWHTGYSDASAAIALDSNYMVIGDDEINSLFVASRKKSGLFLKHYDFGDSLSLTDGSAGSRKEVDVEACVRSIKFPQRIYWTGSMSNAGSDNVYKPNSNTLFATNITGTGSTAAFSVAGYYHGLRQQLITWGDAHGYNFTSSTSDGHDAKTIDGFNVEGITIGPDNTTLYIGFRAPLVPTANRTKAVIAPLTNFESWFNNGNPSGNPTFGAPIEMDLGGRGIRDIVHVSNGAYIIIAGNYDNTPLVGAVYQWSGNAADAPVQLSLLDISSLNAEACLEIDQNGQIQRDRLEIISDNGSTEFYNDGTEAKDISSNTINNYKKYRSDIIIAPSSVVPVKIEYFNAEKQNATASLSWKISSSDDIASFDVMRSIDGKNFTTIQSQQALSIQTIYTYADKNITSSSVYYRIRITQKNGEVYYTNVRLLSFSDDNSVIKLFPNPVVKSFFYITNSPAGTKQVRIYDTKGSLFKMLSFNTSSVDVNTNNWAKGVYVVEIIGSNGKVIATKAVQK